ncbi:MAG: response regulator [Bacteroidota bacterium]|nr:response regulator [Bacteroidota bacterium]
MKRILVVDDDKDILNILKIVLKMNGFEVMVTPNGEEALAKSVSYSPQLVLLDVFLSGTDGRDICNILKNNPDTKDIPVVMFSAHSNMQDILQVCNADDFIAKPFDIAELVEKINLHLEHNHS